MPNRPSIEQMDEDLAEAVRILKDLVQAWGDTDTYEAFGREVEPTVLEAEDVIRWLS